MKSRNSVFDLIRFSVARFVVAFFTFATKTKHSSNRFDCRSSIVDHKNQSISMSSCRIFSESPRNYDNHFGSVLWCDMASNNLNTKRIMLNKSRFDVVVGSTHRLIFHRPVLGQRWDAFLGRHFNVFESKLEKYRHSNEKKQENHQNIIKRVPRSHYLFVAHLIFGLKSENTSKCMSYGWPFVAGQTLVRLSKRQ